MSTTGSESSFFCLLDRGDAGTRGEGGRRGGLDALGGVVSSDGLSILSVSMATDSVFFKSFDDDNVACFFKDFVDGEQPRN